MGAVLALAAALGFGVSDFCAALASRRVHFLRVGVVAQSVAAVLVTASLPWTGTGRAGPAALVWGALSGLGGAAGTLALYRGFGRGEVAVVAPLSAVGSAALPALAGAALGERLGALALAGVLLALPAIWLMARPPGAGHPTRPAGVRAGVVDGLLAGAGFAVLYVALERAGDGAGLWPVASGQVLGALLFWLALLSWRAPTSAVTSGRAASAWLLAAVGGALGVSATILYFFAAHAGLLTVAAVLTSIYPAVTVVLAAVLLHERPDRLQLLGLGLGAVAVVAIVTG